MIRVYTHPRVGLAARTCLTGFVAPSGYEGWRRAVANAGALGSMATFARRCTG
jgi:hypothetical protein